jgi:alpha-tubulin suppressor-like RCC1 family protein
MKQYPVKEESYTGSNEDPAPRLLSDLPHDGGMAEVWCGSEFTIAADAEDGALYGVGWNEHGNLGFEHDHQVVTDWQPVQSWTISDVPRVHLWEGSVAAGGSHVIYLPKS